MSDKITRLSQAIRLGATFHPQCFGSVCVRGPQNNIVETCALGAAAEAVFGESVFRECFGSELIDRLYYRFQFLNSPMGLDRPTWAQWIATRNDKDKWSREKIADELEAGGY